MNTKIDDLFVNARVPVVLVDAEGSVCAVNPSFETTTGFSGGEIRGRPFRDLVKPNAMEIPGLEKEGTTRNVGWEIRLEAKSKKSAAFRMEEIPLGKDGEEGKAVFFFDRSELETLFGDNLHMARLASLGKLLAGIIHEISNPLAIIHGCTQLLQLKSLPPDVASDIDRIHSESKRTVDLVRRVLSFARKNHDTEERVAIQAVIEETAILKRYSLKNNNIQLVFSPRHNAPLLVNGFKNQLIQVFLNLINNSEQAITEAGGKGTIVVHLRKEKDQAVITISDDGAGIAQKDREKIFSAFFTTKTDDRGTGMGLYISRNIVRGHGGDLSLVEDGSGKTAFQVTLSLWKEEDAMSREANAGEGS